MRFYDKANPNDKEWASAVYQMAKKLVIEVCRQRTTPLAVAEFYAIFQDRYASLTRDNIMCPGQPTQPHWQHLLRSAIERLKRDGVIRRAEGGGWVVNI